MTFEEYIVQYFDSLRNCKLKDAMYYAIEGGKHFRPNLLFAVTDGFNIEREKAYPAALAIEMVHSYSLIHDDLPCMDDDDMRRGKPSVHKAFGYAIAVLAGDGLLTHAFGVIVDSEYSYEIKTKMISELSSLAGLNGMLYGQYLDISHSAKEISEDLLNEIEDYKTAALFECALFFGMFLANDEEHIAFYQALAIKIGRVFQLQDDLFEVIKTSKETGKNPSDLVNDKATAISLYSCEELRDRIAYLFKDIYKDLTEASFDEKYLKAIIKEMEVR